MRERETDPAQSLRQSADLTKQLNQPFAHEAKLEATTKRQQEIVMALDITRNQAPAILAEDSQTDEATQQNMEPSAKVARASVAITV